MTRESRVDVVRRFAKNLTKPGCAPIVDWDSGLFGVQGGLLSLESQQLRVVPETADFPATTLEPNWSRRGSSGFLLDPREYAGRFGVKNRIHWKMLSMTLGCVQVDPRALAETGIPRFRQDLVY